MTETHLFSYRHNDRWYTVDIPAESEADARERLKALAWAKYDGVLVMRIPVFPGYSVVARLVCGWLRFWNWIRRV